jgi:hypothetical protein
MNKKGEEGVGYSLGKTGDIILTIMGLIAMLVIIYFLAKAILK